MQFFSIRFLLGLAEAGFYPGVIVYLTHWFPLRDRTKALAWFFIGTPLAAIIGPPISERVMSIGTDGNPAFLGIGRLAVGVYRLGNPRGDPGNLILFYLTDRPTQARWLTDEERTALEETLAREKHEQKRGIGHLTVGQALANPKVLALAAAYYFVVTGSYGIELYMASIVKDWYGIGRQGSRLSDHYPCHRRLDRPDLDRLEFGPHPRATLACLAADHPRRGRAGLHPRHKGTYG